MSDNEMTWRVTSQPMTTAQDATGNFVKGRNVTYQTSTGLTGTVFVPNANLTVDFVRQAIQDDLAKITPIANLTSES